MPGFIKRLGTGLAAFVLAWLTTVLNSPSSLRRTFVRPCSDGGRCMLANRAEIADATGLSEAAVKRGLAPLPPRLPLA